MIITDAVQIEKYYKALVEKDENYLGIFYVGVKTTGIFCIPTCYARKPKFENVEFSTEAKELLKHGYRPCKLCKPTQNAHQAPPEIQKALALLKAKPMEKIKDYELRQNGLSPENIRRWFKKHHGITFQAYQRMVRINTAFQDLQKGKKITHTAFDAGYESLSGFNYTFKKMLGKAPTNSKNKTVILMDRLTTPLGPMFACATDQGICLLEFTDRRMLETEFKDLQTRLNAVILNGQNEHLQQLKQELAEYFEGKRSNFEVALHTPSTAFRQQVWTALLEVPYGETRSYQQQAQLLGNANAVRAVASANGHNRVAIVIPCHRILGKDGNLRGYAGGLERKKWLLEHEQKFCNDL